MAKLIVTHHKKIRKSEKYFVQVVRFLNANIYWTGKLNEVLVDIGATLYLNGGAGTNHNQFIYKEQTSVYLNIYEALSN